MVSRRIKSLLAASFSVFLLIFSAPAMAQENHDETPAKETKLFDANEVIFGHIMDGHEFHFMSYKSGGKDKHVTIPLPVILYSPERGLDMFMSSKFHHGHESHKGYALVTEHLREELHLDPKKYFLGSIIPVTAEGELDSSVKLYDISLTRNVVQMILAMTILFLIAFTTLLLVNDYLVATFLTDDFRVDDHTLQCTAALHLTVVFREVYFVEFQRFTGIAFQAVHKNLLVLLNFKLLSGYINDCVHGLSAFTLLWVTFLRDANVYNILKKQNRGNDYFGPNPALGLTDPKAWNRY